MNIRFISAGAGSGKTYRLTELLSERLATGKVRPAAVIGTTFTKKAAAELVERVRQRLVGDGQYASANSMGQALIGTVNSVCGQILSRYAFEAGLSPKLQVLGEEDQPVLFAQALDQAMSAEEIRRMNEIANRLGLEDWQLEVKKIVDFARANDIGVDRLSEQAAQSVAELLAFLPEPMAENPDQGLRLAVRQAINDITANEDSTKGTVKYLDLLRSLESRIGGPRQQWSDWVKLTNEKPTKRSLAAAEPVQNAASVYEQHPGLHEDIRNWTIGLFELAIKALESYQRFKDERGVMDFVDQESQVLRLLDRPEVADSIAQELDLLLVDEFQDTSPIQLALFLKLATLAGECIWVGDVKQAIYGFRGTDPELMKAVMESLEAEGHPVEVLPKSRRSRPELVELVNELFVPAFADYLPDHQVRLEPARETHTTIPALQFWGMGGSNQEQRAAELAHAIAGLLASETQVVDKVTKQARPIRAVDIALLSRSNRLIDLYAAAMTSAGLVVAVEQPGLLATPEVHLALACLRRLVDPRDTLASAEIIALKTCKEPETWLQDRLEYLAGGGSSHQWGVEGTSVEPALVSLEDLRRRLRFLSPVEVLDDALAAGEVFANAKAWGPTVGRSDQRLSNLETLRGMAVDYEEHCGAQRLAATVGGFLLWLYDLEEQKLDKRGAESQGGAVQLLTYHRAKGLEWPVVIMADLEAGERGRLWGLSVVSERNRFNMNAPLDGRRLRYWPWPFGKMAKNIQVAAEVEESSAGVADKQQQVREAIRLMYVGMTRARDLLMLALKEKTKMPTWLGTLGADWVIPDGIWDDNQGQLDMPNGKSIPYGAELIQIEEETHSPAPDAFVPWFPGRLNPTPKLPARINPSLEPPVVSASIGDVVEFAPRLDVKGNPDMGTVGDTLHNIFAAGLLAPGHPNNKAMAEGVLVRHHLGAALEPAAVLSQVEQLREMLEERFRPKQMLPEWPVTVTLDNGQIINGWIDLLIETDEGWVIIDHKSFPGKRAEWSEKALAYSGQLGAYRAAVERATGEQVASQWVHFSVGGGLVEIKMEKQG